MAVYSLLFVGRIQYLFCPIPNLNNSNLCLSTYGTRMGGSTVVGHGGGGHVPSPRLLEINVKSLIFTIGTPRFITFAYCVPPKF